MVHDLEALKTAAKVGWLYVLPLIEVAAVRARPLPLNSFHHMARLADHRARVVTTPNNDTLYASGHIDLGQGPVTVTLPDTGDRYFSLALMDAWSNNFAVLGTRTTGPEGGTVTIVGPTDAAEGPNVVRSPTRHVWALARTLVDGAADLAAADAVQRGLSMQGPAASPAKPPAPRSAAWQDYFASAAELMRQNPPPVTDRAILRQMAPLGLDAFDPAGFTAEEAAAIEAGVAEARATLRGSAGLGGANVIDGWSYPGSNLGDFGQDYIFRAGVALGGLAALPPVEAMYMRASGPEPRGLFDGSKAWRLYFAADRLIPVNAFWSLSLYEATDEGQFFFSDNPLGRYIISDRTEGLTANPDGSLDIWIGHDSPGPARESNWLPAPAGPFALFMRAYLPKAALLDGVYRLPPVEES